MPGQGQVPTLLRSRGRIGWGRDRACPRPSSLLHGKRGDMTELAGVMVGNYFLLECLEREGMVETYRARPTTRGGCDVVLRIYRPAFPDPTGFQEHFSAEVEKVWRCHHEHIQPLIEYGAGDDLLYTVTQVTEAETLERFLERWEDGQPDAPVPALLPLPVVERILAQIGSALHYVHEHQIVHGNIQLESILVAHEGYFLLTDFSMKSRREETHAVVTEAQGGNAAYMSPEQSLGILSPACDIYALGVLLFRLLTGRLPYDGESPDAIALKHADEPIPSVREWRPDVPEALELVTRVALAKTPAARFPTAAAFVEALDAAIRNDAPPVVITTAPIRRIPVRARRTALTWSRVFTLLSVLVMLCSLSGVIFFFAANPFHLENLPFLPSLQKLGGVGKFHINPSNGTTPTTGTTPVTTSTAQQGTTGGKAPSSRGHTTPVVGGTPLPGTSPTVTPYPTVTQPPETVVCA